MSAPLPAPRNLEDLRREIDEIDAQLHALLMRRTEVSRQIGKAKERVGPRVRTGREAIVMRNLVARHRGSLPKAVLLRIWREIISDSTAQQGPFSLSVYSGDAASSLGELAREFFGVLTPIAEQGSPVRVLNDVASGAASLGILPIFAGDSDDPWWRHLARDAADVPRIVGRLPFAPWPRDRAADTEALVVSLGMPEPSGADRSYLVVELRERMSRAALKDLLTRHGLLVRETATWTDGEGAPTSYSLAEVEGFLEGPQAPPLADLLEAAGDKVARVWTVGSYPVPLSEADMAGEGARPRARS